MKSFLAIWLFISIAPAAFAQWQTGTQTTSMGRWAYYKPGSQYENLGYGVRTNLAGGWAWQLVDGNDASYFHVEYPTGNVGIGTNAPAARFHLVDTNVNIYSSTGVSNSWSKDGLTVFANPDAGYSTLKIQSAHSPVSDRGVLNVIRGTTSLFYVRTDGNLGIGTEAPEAKLHVNGDIRIPSTSKMVFGTQAGGFGEYIQNYSNGLGLYTNSARRVVIDNSGNMGIGINAPTSMLEIQGTSDGTLRPTIKMRGYNNYDPELRLSEGANWVGGYMKYDVAANKMYIGYHSVSDKEISNDINTITINRGNGRVGINTTSPGTEFSVNGTISSTALSNSSSISTVSLSASGAITAGSLNATGNVGIGTTNPDSKLTVKGIIHAEEVKVDLNVPGPDYVFESDYPLVSLEDTKAYIEQNKHLPGIPSSDEMQQNGVNLLEMNMKLLEKVEELTLYLIEQKELHTNLESTLLQRIEALERKFNCLK
jgi:hypothetical protein